MTWARDGYLRPDAPHLGRNDERAQYSGRQSWSLTSTTNARRASKTFKFLATLSFSTNGARQESYLGPANRDRLAFGVDYAGIARGARHKRARR